MVGVAGKLVVKVENSVEPMPTMTASTSTFTPEEMTLPRTRSAAKAVLPNRPKGISTKPHSVDSLNSMRLTKSWMASTKNEISTTAQANSSTVIWMKFSKKLTKAHQPGNRLQDGLTRIQADLRHAAGLQEVRFAEAGAGSLEAECGETLEHRLGEHLPVAD